MPRIKRVILWEGNPNDLPNRKVKSNVVFSNTNNLGSRLMKCYENAQNPSLPYNVPIPPKSYRVVVIKHISKVEEVSGMYVWESIMTAFAGESVLYPTIKGWAQLGGYAYPGVYLFYNNGNTEVEAKIIPASNDIDLSSLPTITSGIYILPLNMDLIFGSLTNTRMKWNDDNSGCVLSYGSMVQVGVILRESSDTQGKYITDKFSINNIRDILETGEDALVLFCNAGSADTTILSADFSTNYVRKTYEQLGIDDLYEEWQEQNN